MKKIIIILFVLAVAVVSCNKSGTDSKKTELASLKKQQAELSSKILKMEEELAKENPEENKKMHFVELQKVSKGTFTHYVEVQGKVESEQNVNILPRAMGPITNVYVEPGTIVRKGQLLATIDDAIIRKSIDELQNRLDLATVVYSKQKNLWDQKIGTEIQFLQAKNNKDALDRAMSTANEQLSLTKIKSPINGTVDQVDIKVGEMANAMKPAMRVVNLQQLKVTAELAESYLKAIKIGDKAKVNLPDLNKMIDAKVTFVGRVINPSSRTFSIDVKIGNSNDLRPNMIAMLSIIDYKAKNVFSIPMNIVQNDQAGQYVMVAVKNGDKIVAAKRAIKTGFIYKGTVEVKTGLKEGEELIITGYQNLNEGDLIKL